MYSIRNLIADAYRESGVVGPGMTVQAHEESSALSTLNLVLDEIYAGNDSVPSQALDVTFNGASEYTIGPAATGGADEPDILVNAIPGEINQIIVTVGGSRIVCTAVDPITYFSRADDDLVSNPVPYGFYYEQGNPLGTIRFLEGAPTGAGQLIFKPSLVDVTSNTDYKYYPRALKPYLVYELAARIAEANTFDATALKMKSTSAWTKYKQNVYEGQGYHCDASAPSGRGDKYNIYAGE